MKTQFLFTGAAKYLPIALFSFFMGIRSTSFAQVKNVVIVHGAFADGSGWRKVFQILSAKGYQVSIVQNPLTCLKDDVEATSRVLDNRRDLWFWLVIPGAGL